MRHHRRKPQPAGFGWLIGGILFIIALLFIGGLIAQMLPLMIAMGICSALGVGKSRR